VWSRLKDYLREVRYANSAGDMTPADLASRVEAQVPTWEVRLVLSLPLHPLVSGAAIGAGLVALAFLYTWAFGFPVFAAAPDQLFDESLSTTLLFASLVGYSYGAMAYGTLAVVELLPQDAPLEAANAESVVARNRSRIAGAIGALLGWAMIEALIVMDGANPIGSWYYPTPDLLTLWLIPLLGWLGGRASYYTVLGTRTGIDGDSPFPEIDLMDLSTPRALGRMGLRFALLWLLAVAIMTPAIVDFDDPLGPRTAVVIASLLMAVVALVLPVRGVRRHIRAAKRAELQRVDDAVRGSETAAQALHLPAKFRDARLADLIAYRGLIETVQEWPYDTSTLRRFALYMLLPLLSWAAAALVERVINQWLG
jgi:hypothetical protein